MKIQALASTFTDNFFYLVHDRGEALLFDPIDADVAVAAVRALDPKSIRVVTTHGHPDHAGGNAAVKEALGCDVLAPAVAERWPVEHDVGLRHGDTLSIGEASIAVRHAPGHTDDHLVFIVDEHLLSGDVFFVAGAGNCRTGDPGQLYRTFHERLGDLPDEMTFYPGHDYAKKNLDFCLMVEPDNERAAELRELAERWTRDQGPFLTTLGQERAFNPFHRVHDEELQAKVAERFTEAVDDAVADPAERTFRAVRALRDRF